MRWIGQKLGFAALLFVGACQGPDQYLWDLPDAGGNDGPAVTGLGGSGPGTGGSVIGTGGMPTGFGGTTGTAGNAGTAGNVGTTGTAGTGGSPAGTGGMMTGTAGTTGAGGSAAGRGGTTGAAGTTGGRGGTTGAAGNTGMAGNTGTGGSATGRGGTTGGRGGTTGAAGSASTAGTTGAGGSATGRGGTTGTGTGGGTGMVLYNEDFESDSVGAMMASGWSRAGGSSDDWTIASDGTKVLQQAKSTSSTIRVQSATSASGAPWSGAVSASARVKLLDTGSNGQAALLCVRYNDTSNRYCGALVPSGVQIQTTVGGSSGSGAIISATVAVGTFYDLRISVDASNVLTIYLGGTMRGTYTPMAMTNGTVAVGTTSAQAAFDNITVTRP